MVHHCPGISVEDQWFSSLELESTPSFVMKHSSLATEVRGPSAKTIGFSLLNSYPLQG